MKFSELNVIFMNYDTARWSPTRSSIRFGCDCGCGGDRYTKESWDEEEAIAAHSIATMKEWCIHNNIEWDGVE